MGWSTGSSIFEEVASVIRSHVPDYADRVDIYMNIIPIFEDYDAELYDIVGSVDDAFDDAYEQLHPEQDKEDYEEE